MTRQFCQGVFALIATRGLIVDIVILRDSSVEKNLHCWHRDVPDACMASDGRRAYPNRSSAPSACADMGRARTRRGTCMTKPPRNCETAGAEITQLVRAMVTARVHTQSDQAIFSQSLVRAQDYKSFSSRPLMKPKVT